MRVCTRLLFVLAIAVFLSFTIEPLSGQGAKVRSAYEAIQDQERDQPSQREQWFLHGRSIPGQSAAALRYRAHMQKMLLRATRPAAAQAAAGKGLSPDAGTTWTALGPAPLASDATGFGGQDYDWVSGRATAVAIDPADLTGNTVFVGGAYGASGNRPTPVRSARILPRLHGFQ